MLACGREGPAGLFRGLTPILLKEVPFVVTKFVVFDAVSSSFAAVSADAANPAVALALTLASGALAGIAAVIVSQPADTVLTLTADAEGGETVSEALARVRDQPRLITSGLGPRLLYGMLLVTLQFLIFTQLKSALGVSQNDLTLVWDPLAPLRP